jgi:tRNA threonylcarbamoyladenosine biosynthesis protein TsaE
VSATSAPGAPGAPWPLTVETSSPEATRAVAGRVARACRPGDVVLLVGDLGAGKTVFAQGFAAALGVAGPVTSPTFALVRHYRGVPEAGAAPGTGVRQLIHADVYRTGSLEEVTDLARPRPQRAAGLPRRSGPPGRPDPAPAHPVGPRQLGRAPHRGG